MPKGYNQPWSRIDPLLVIAAMAETPEKRNAEYWRISKKFDVRMRTLHARLRWLQVRHIDARMGAKAIDLWKREMDMLAQAMGNPIRLHSAIVDKYRSTVKRLKAETNRPVSAIEAAHILGITAKRFYDLIEGMELIERNDKGELTLGALREFYEREGRSLLVRHNLYRRNVERESDVPRGTLR